MKKSLRNFILPLIGFIIVIMFLLFSIFRYNSSDVSYDMLEQREFTFSSYRFVSHVRGGSRHEVYVMEETKPLIIDSDITKVIDLAVLEKAEKGDKLVVWASPAVSEWDFRKVYEGTINDEMFLSLAEFRRYSQKSGMVGIVLSSVVGVGILGLSVWLWVCDKKRKQ